MSGVFSSRVRAKLIAAESLDLQVCPKVELETLALPEKITEDTLIALR